MGARWFNGTLLLFWLASMGWLISSKVLPTLQTAENVDQDIFRADDGPRTETWSIFLDDHLIGWASDQIISQPGGGGVVESQISLEKLPVERIVAQVFGAMRWLIPADTKWNQFNGMRMTVHSRLQFNRDLNLDRVTTTVDVPGLGQSVRLEGIVDGGKLEVIVGASGDSQSLFRHQVELPDEIRLSDTLTTHARYSDLAVGRRWTVRSLRPFPPNAQLHELEATVESEDILIWNSGLVNAFRITFRPLAGSVVSAGRSPTTQLWALTDGTVIKQELDLSGMRMVFIRQSPAGE